MSMEPTATGSVPAGWRILHRSLLVAVLGFYFFLVYACMRGVLAEFGSAPGTVARTAAATVAMAAFVVWLAPLADLPEILFGHLLPRRRLERSACPSCGHPSAKGGGPPCPECGRMPFEPLPWQPGAATARRFAIILAGAITVGVAAGEWWTLADEARFRRESAMRSDSFLRPRAWPAEFATLRYDPAKGISAHRRPDAVRIPGWKPAREEPRPETPPADSSPAPSR